MRRPLMALVAFLLLAVLGPATWQLTRPSGQDGPPVATIGTAPSATGKPAGAGPGAPSAGQAGIGSGPVIGTFPAPTAEPAPAVALPVRLVIPAIGVSARIDPMGVEPDSSMALPEDVKVVGWYRFGPAPGADQGAAVLAGHVDDQSQGRGAMFRLRELGVGALVSVTGADAGTVGYRVVAKETIVKKRLPTERLFARDGAPRLILITCGGPFLPELSSYQDNVVIVAEPVS
jgi:Sortase domain